jgi:hypothetical protein
MYCFRSFGATKKGSRNSGRGCGAGNVAGLANISRPLTGGVKAMEKITIIGSKGKTEEELRSFVGRSLITEKLSNGSVGQNGQVGMRPRHYPETTLRCKRRAVPVYLEFAVRREKGGRQDKEPPSPDPRTTSGSRSSYVRGAGGFVGRRPQVHVGAHGLARDREVAAPS